MPYTFRMPASTIWSTRISATVCAMLLLCRSRRGQRSMGRYSGSTLPRAPPRSGRRPSPGRCPAAVAVLTTSTATVAETSRSREMSGSRPLRRIGGVGELRERTGRRDEQRRRHRRGAAHDDAEPEAREHQRVVGLPDAVRRAVALDRLRTGCRSRPAQRRRSTPAGSPGSARRARSGSTSAG